MNDTRITITEHDVPADKVAGLIAIVVEHDRPDQIDCQPGRLQPGFAKATDGPAFYNVRVENIKLATVNQLDTYRKENSGR